MTYKTTRDETDASAPEKTTNRTGLPDGLKAKMEGTFGTDLSHIRVNKNSSFPAKVGAIATTQGHRIDFAPGQYNPHSAQGQKLIGHEAWHTVQQAQGRVKPTLQMKTGHLVNDSEALEAEADRMGERVVQSPLLTPVIRTATAQNQPEPIQRKIKFNNGTKKATSFNNKGKFLQSQIYKELTKVSPYKEDIQLVDQLIGEYDTDNTTFESVEHFRQVLDYDLSKESKEFEPAQLAYLTHSGWKKKYTHDFSSNYADTQSQYWKSYEFSGSGNPSAVVEAMLEDAAKISNAQIKLYRNMSKAEAEVIDVGNLEGLGAHLGDYKQSLGYYHRDKNEHALVEFVLKPGAEEVLFSPQIAAIQASGKTTAIIADYQKRKGHGNYAKASKNEGTLDGYIGIKSEDHGEMGFSISLGDKKSKQLFQKLVASVNVVMKNY